MLKWPIRECKAVNRSGYGYGGKRVNPTNLALDGRKLVDYSSSDDSPPNGVDDSPTSPPRKMLRLHYGPAQGHVEWTPVDEHQPSSSLMFPSSTYRVCCNIKRTLSPYFRNLPLLHITIRLHLTSRLLKFMQWLARKQYVLVVGNAI